MTQKAQKVTAVLAQISFLVVFVMAIGMILQSEKAYAEDVTPDGVAGCMAVQVDPQASLEAQQAICENAEQFFSSSCAASGHGHCSSPKTNGVLVEGTNCICLDESEEAVAETSEATT